MNFLLKSTILSLILCFFLPAYTHAQVPSSIDGVDISVNNESPRPGEKITVSVESYNTDLNAASIVWVVDGKNAAQGIGIKSIDLVAPKIGKRLNVVVAIMTVEKREVKKTININASDLDLIWESGGYTPPLFEGKAYFAYQNSIKIIALPHISSNGKEIDPRTLVYRWKVNDKAQPDKSGYGKQILMLKEDFPGQVTIDLTAETKDGAQKADARIVLVPGNPSISFYEEDPLYGVLYNQALVDTVRLRNKEMNIISIPYSFNFNPSDSPPSLSTTWSINNLEQSDLVDNRSITVRTEGDKEGSSLLSVDVKNSDDILQGAKNVLNIVFSKQSLTQTNENHF